MGFIRKKEGIGLEQFILYFPTQCHDKIEHFQFDLERAKKFLTSQQGSGLDWISWCLTCRKRGVWAAGLGALWLLVKFQRESSEAYSKLWGIITSNAAGSGVNEAILCVTWKLTSAARVGYYCASCILIHGMWGASIHPSNHPFIHPPIHLTVRPSIHLSIHPSIHRSIYPSIHTSTSSSTHVPIHPSTCLPIHSSIHSSI